MTQPSPPSDINGLLEALGKQVDATSSSTSTNLYGLGQWGTQTVDPGDLPFLTSIVATGQATTGDAILKAFAGAAPDQVATIQHALLMAGYYPSTYNPKYGVVSPADVTAFGHLVKTAGQAGQPVATLLSNAAAYGATAGIAAAQGQAAAAAKTAEVRLPNATDLESLATAAFQKALGHKANPEDAARFAALYRAMSAGVQRAANSQMYDATSPPVPTALQGDPAQLVQNAITPAHPQIHESGAGNLNPLVATGGTGGQPLSLTEKIGGLMDLGQQLMEPGSAQPTGLTQLETETPVSPDVAAENYARNAHPNQAAANDLANVFNTFLGLLQGVA